jgi:flavin-dependent dehydrogenase
MPDGVARLQELGVEIGDRGRPFRGIRYLDADTTAEGRFPDEPGMGVRRTELHGALCRRAEEVGVRLFWGVGVRGLLADGFHTDRGEIRGRWLVGADGRHSLVRRWAGLDAGPASRRRFGIRRHYRVEPWTDLVEVYWADGAEAYVTPVGPQLVGVVLMTEGKSGDFGRLLARFPALDRRLASVPVASSDRGAGPLEQRCRRVAQASLALVGDASGSLDTITGEGLALAFHESESLVDAVLAGELERYVQARRAIIRYPKAITQLLLLVARYPRLRRRVMRSLAGDSTLMSRFLELKMRGDARRVLGADGLLRLTAAAVRGGV